MNYGRPNLVGVLPDSSSPGFVYSVNATTECGYPFEVACSARGSTGTLMSVETLSVYVNDVLDALNGLRRDDGTLPASVMRGFQHYALTTTIIDDVHIDAELLFTVGSRIVEPSAVEAYMVEGAGAMVAVIEWRPTDSLPVVDT